MHQSKFLLTYSSLIAPLGDHRRTHTHPSKGKKRKRNIGPTTQDDSTKAETAPPAPEIGKHLLIGLNSVTRHLEALAAKNAPPTVPVSDSSEREDAEAPKEKDPEVILRPLSMVILTHPKPSLSPAHVHLPTLVHLSTLSTVSAPATTTRLITLPTSAEARLASTLHIPRVGALAIYADAPATKGLEEYVYEHVGVTESKWIDEAMKADWKGLNVKSEIPGAKE
jgi:ribonuclease P/MRP protein subunit POP3